jgi:xanthine dehydrogenase accessory factor
LNDLSRVIQVLKSRKTERFALATVIGVKGSSYRNEGAKMLIDEKSNLYGMISGGCLEEDIIHHAKVVLQLRKPKMITYDHTSDNDLSWGPWSGCNGIIYVYLEETSWDILKDKMGNSLWETIDHKLLLGHPVASLKLIDEDCNQKDLIYYAGDGEILYGLDDFENSNLTFLEAFIENEKKTEIITFENQRFLAELFKPKEPLYIFGAGPDIRLLAELVSQLDFSVRLIDPRNERFENGHFSNVDQQIIEFPHLFLQNNAIPANSFVLIMTHHFQWDQNVLPYFIKKPPQYLGILGSKKRTERLFHDTPIPEWVHSPVGMDIGAEGPEEIAISICAELIKFRNANR